jgi:DNA-binding NarL/FixJ family response regulator
MKILIIEDSDYKIQSLISFLNSMQLAEEVEVARSYQTAKKLLKEFSPELVLLDMTLPTSEKPDGQLEGRNRIFGGRDILAEIEFLDVECHVIIVTQFDSFGEPPNTINAKDLFQQLSSKYKRYFIGGVYYSNVDSSWQGQLKLLLKTIKKKKS